MKPEEALKRVKEESGKVKRSARDGRRAEAMMQLAQAAVHLSKAEAVKAVQLGSDASSYFQREQDWSALLEVLEVVAPAHLQRGDGKKAMDCGNLMLDVAQKMKDHEAVAASEKAKEKERREKKRNGRLYNGLYNVYIKDYES